MKIIKCLIIVLSLILLSGSLFAPTLVLDAENDFQPPKKFRMTPLKSRLRLMGSAQFSENNLRYIIQNCRKPDIIFDLRQESHGFLNGSAISWYGRHNWANIKKTEQEIQLIEAKLLHLLRNQNTEIVYQTKPNQDPIEIHPSTVLNEEQLAQKYDIKYLRIPVTDHSRPSDQQVDYFVNKIAHLPPNQWLYFHCRGGKGRTTTFMAMVDIMKNAKTTRFEEILKRQYDLGGKNLTENNPAKSRELTDLAEARLSFLQNFYDYCKYNKDRFKTSWSKWQKRSHLNYQTPYQISL